MKLPHESEMAFATLAGTSAALTDLCPAAVEHIDTAIAKLREIIGRQIEALEEAKEYFDNRADADCEGDPMRFVPNKEMQLASAMRNAVHPEVWP